LKDQELLLRFFAFAVEAPQYKRPMRRFLNKFLDDNENISAAKEKELRLAFDTTIVAISDALGKRAFRPESQLNTAVFDSVMIGLSRRLARTGRKPAAPAIKNAYEKLIANERFRAAYTRATADEEQVRTRLKLATDAFSAV